MTVIETKSPSLPRRAWRWAADTLGMFWFGFGDYMRSEYEALRRRK